MADWLLSIGTGANQKPLILAAKMLGFKILGLDRAPDTGLVDAALKVSTHEPDMALAAVLAWQQDHQDLTGLIARTSGPAIITAAHVAEALGLKGYSTALADCSFSKSALASISAALAIPHVPSLPPDGIDALPVVVKPDAPLRGKEAVTIIRKIDQLQAAMARAAEASANGQSLVQPFIDGAEFGLAAAVRQGRLVWHCYYQEQTTETEGAVRGVSISGPADNLPQETTRLAVATVRRMVAHWQNSGFCFFSFRANTAGIPLVFEVNPGLCGDQIADQLLPAMWPGVNFFALDVALMTGQPANFPKLPGINCQIGA